MSAKSAALSITATSYAAANAPDFDAGFVTHEQELYLTSASVVAFSYDGVSDHGRLDNTNFKSAVRKVIGQRIWFRVVSGTNPATLVVSAWD